MNSVLKIDFPLDTIETFETLDANVHIQNLLDMAICTLVLIGLDKYVLSKEYFFSPFSHKRLNATVFGSRRERLLLLTEPLQNGQWVCFTFEIFVKIGAYLQGRQY
jgi:hypothetical protein